MVHDSQFVKREVVNNYSLLYSIQGSTPGKLPYLLASHLDVVPADPKTWEVPPFSGNIINKTYIYGRGAIDDKSGVLVSFYFQNNDVYWYFKLSANCNIRLYVRSNKICC